MAAITVTRTISATQAAISQTPISFQIAKMGSKVEWLRKELESPKRVTIFEAKRIETDARSLLSEYRYYLQELSRPAASRDPDIMWFDRESRTIVIDEDPREQEIRRCGHVIDRIESSGLSLSTAKKLRSYEILADETYRVYFLIRIITEGMGSSIKGFLTKEIDSIRRSPLELRGLEAVADELYDAVKIHSENLKEHRAGKVNLFAPEGKERFIRAAERANRIAMDVVFPIFECAHKQLNKEPEGAPPSPIFRIFRRIYDTADRTLESLETNQDILLNPKAAIPLVRSTQAERIARPVSERPQESSLTGSLRQQGLGRNALVFLPTGVKDTSMKLAASDGRAKS